MSLLRFTAKSVLFLAVVGMAASANAALIAGWEMNGVSGFGPSPFAPSTPVANLSYVGLTRGAGVTTSGSPAANAWGGNGFDSVSLSAAVAAGDFASFSVTPDAGYSVSFSELSRYNVRRSGTGPTTGQWQFQVGSGSWTDIGSAITWGGTTNASGNLQSPIDLSSITALQNVIGQSVSFRVVNWGGTSSGGTWYFNQFQDGNDLILMGSVSAVPEPSSLLISSIFGLGGLVIGRRRKR